MSCDLQPIHAKSFINRLHLVFHAFVEIFDVTFFSCLQGLNRPKNHCVGRVVRSDQGTHLIVLSGPAGPTTVLLGQRYHRLTFPRGHEPGSAETKGRVQLGVVNFCMKIFRSFDH